MNIVLCMPETNNENLMSGNLMFGGGDMPSDTRMYCFNITIQEDVYKEGVEFFVLRLQSDDDCVCLGRDVASVRVEANGGIIDLDCNAHGIILA